MGHDAHARHLTHGSWTAGEQHALLVAAGVVAGIVGTAGGIASLVSYPALLAVGLAPLPANVANLVALVPYLPGSVLGSRLELEERGSWLWPWIPLAALGGAGGAALLRTTPPGVFAKVVPFLVAAASVGLLVQPRLRRFHEQRGGAVVRLVFPLALFAVQVYSGYFGAGSGVMTLTLILVAVEPHMVKANALKNVLVGAAIVASAAVLVGVVRVPWAYALPLAAGMLVGSFIGPAVARRVPANLLRWIVAFVGLGLAVKLWVALG